MNQAEPPQKVVFPCYEVKYHRSSQTLNMKVLKDLGELVECEELVLTVRTLKCRITVSICLLKKAYLKVLKEKSSLVPNLL